MAHTPKLSLLGSDQLERLHQAGLDILDRFGIRVEDPAVRTLLGDNGCRVEGERVFFSADLVAKAVANQRKSVTLRSLAGGTLDLEIGKMFSHSTGGAPWMIDAETGKRRVSQLSDLVDCIHVMNQLSNLDIPCALVYPGDVRSEITQLVQMATMFEYAKKPVYGPGISMSTNARYIAELFKIYGGDDLAQNPIGLVGISPESPLFLPKEITDTTRYIVEAGIPVSILSAPIGGLSAPLTVLGTVAQCHAEILSYATVAYLMNPDCVMFYGARCFFANMKTCQSILGLPESGLASAFGAELATYCGFMSDFYGITCTSCTMDEQTGYEKMINGLLPALAGGTMITGFGSLASVMSSALGQLVLDDEIMAMIKRAMRPVELDDDILGFDAIGAVIGGGETFVSQMHTVDYLRAGEIFAPSIGFDSTFSDWIKVGEPDLNARADAHAKELRARDEVVPADPDIKKEVDALLAAAEKELTK